MGVPPEERRAYRKSGHGAEVVCDELSRRVTSKIFALGQFRGKSHIAKYWSAVQYWG